MEKKGTKRRRPSSAAPTYTAAFVVQEDPTMTGEIGAAAAAEEHERSSIGPEGGELKTGDLSTPQSSSPKRRPSLELLVNPARDGTSFDAGGFRHPQEAPQHAGQPTAGRKSSPETLWGDEEGHSIEPSGETIQALDAPGEVIIAAERAETDSFLHTASNYRLPTGIIRRGSNEWHGGM